MGLFSSILLLPAAPVRGVIWLSGLIQEQVEQQLQDPVRLRRELEEIDRAAAAGDLSAEEAAQAQQEILNRMTGPT
ncbi:gas vesicle protein G [Nocardia nova]|uniref:Gas vesicle protein G n=1 Tax=Nocardia nova TaxID=37330 RepID=A0A2S6AP23_9NOCA|nr:gas vesicle protein GvpG [Nocardia nova]PPJ28854.1 gas vesicle protein G [Nocardia nova]PPJ37027.1 gas vesicle protein G [Nocardia nova]